MSSRLKPVLAVVGAVLVAGAGIGLLGWMQQSDPDCILETGVFLQLRMCAPEFVGQSQSPSFMRLAAILAILAVGLICLWLARRKP